MSKFQVGDMVRVIKNLTYEKTRDEYIGKVYEILSVEPSGVFQKSKWGDYMYSVGEFYMVYEDELELESGYFYNPPFGKFSDDYSYSFQAEVDAIARKAARKREEDAMQSIGDYLTITNSLFCLYPSRYEGDLETISKAIQIHFKGLDPEKAVNEVLSNEDVLFQKCIALLKRYIEYMSN